jgi:nitrogenase molybdenum-iron protein alpha chain
LNRKDDREISDARLIEEVLQAYPEKTAKRRRKHISIAEDGASTAA